ncbi:DUF1073 domain-containing protein [Rufibacter sediminis]|uniref:DUF1073 domain-containing protein n=1 Tax=Rufibacter sediminis TaxID=2762756 RepID=A0ABR6VTV8_9BACT|nr:DUF1073 domain-containing protein [Rufibacter sediminis]MBC3540647.1 DUF1073 domain-containing protein [Rufibacter sediminis]
MTVARRRRARADSSVRSDGYLNVLAGMGGGLDKRSRTKFVGGTELDHITLESMYRFSGFARKVIDIPAHEMTREWIWIENDKNSIGLNKLAALDAKNMFRDVLKWGNLFGGAIMVMGIDDNGTLDMPLDEKNIRDIAFLRVYDRHQISWMPSDINDNPNSPNFGQPEWYTISSYTTVNTFRVHASRVLRFNGADASERTKASNQGWGDSALQAVYEELRDYGIIKASSVSIVQDFVQVILKIQGLMALIAAGREEEVKTRMAMLDLTRSVNNTILLDGGADGKGEDYEKKSSSVTGLPDLIDRFALALSGVTGIPVTKLFGQSPAGLSATGESDIRNFYDDIKSKQEDILLPMLHRLARLMMLSKNGPYKGREPANWNIQFNPLWQMTDLEEVDWKYKIGQTDALYVSNGILSPDEVAISRFGNGFNTDTIIDPKTVRGQTEPDDEE